MYGFNLNRMGALGGAGDSAPDLGELTTVLLRFQGSNGSTTFTNEGTSAVVPVAVGNAQLSTTSPITGVSSLLLDGAGDACSVPNTLGWRDLTQPWTMEFHVLADNYAAGNQVLVMDRSGTTIRLQIRVYDTYLSVHAGTTLANTACSFGGRVLSDTPTAPVYITAEYWNDNTFHLYLDGTEFYSNTVTGFSNTTVTYLGMSSFGSQSPFAGKFGGFRFTQAVRFGEDYTPAPF